MADYRFNPQTTEELQEGADTIGKIFIADYGVTTYAEVVSNYGVKCIFARVNSNHFLYPLTNRVGGGAFFFTAPMRIADSIVVASFSLDSNGWHGAPTVPQITLEAKAPGPAIYQDENGYLYVND